jgi:hypothetical protein
MSIHRRSLGVACAAASVGCVSYDDLRGSDRSAAMPVVEARWMLERKSSGWFAQGRAGGGRGDFDEHLDAGETIDLGDTSLDGPDDIEVEFEVREGHLAFGRRLAREHFEFAWFAGIQWAELELEFDGTLAANDQDERRVANNLMLGLWLAGRLDQHWAVEFTHTRSVPNDSDELFTATYDVFASFRPNPWWRLFAGWRSIELYESGASEIEIELSGPAFGAGVGL